MLTLRQTKALLFGNQTVILPFRRQLSRESLLRSLSRSKAGSRDSLDRWVENGVRSRGMWRKVEEEHQQKLGLITEPKFGTGPRQPPMQSDRYLTTTNKSDKYYKPEKQNRVGNGNKIYRDTPPTTVIQGSGRLDARIHHSTSREKSYKELGEQERFPGLDRETARPLHSSNLSLSQQHIYSEPSFDSHRSSHSITKPKKFSFAFWKQNLIILILGKEETSQFQNGV